MRLLYLIVIHFYHLGIRLAAWFHPKARAWVDGPQDWQEQLAQWRNTLAEDTPILWMHCASLGEFEQGRPVLEQIRQRFPAYKMVLTFYSPSGYEQQRQYPHADYVAYLPPDSPGNARTWVTMLRPQLAIFVKYEFWLFHWQALFRQRVPTFLIAASFRPRQVFFRWYGGMFKKLLQQVTFLFVQTPADRQLLNRHGITAVQVAGDPRVDRVLAIATAEINFPQVASFATGHRVFVAGSTWPPDEAMLLQDQSRWEGDWNLLIAPHDISPRHLDQIAAQIRLPYQRFSQLAEGADLSACRILILDTIGMLSRVYHYGHLAYVGGGFGVNIHNTLEPAAHGLPVLFGPRHQNFPEALALRETGGAFVLPTPADFPERFRQLQDPDQYENARQAVLTYLNNSRGASDKIVAQLEVLKSLKV